jgi:hypothetical protein
MLPTACFLLGTGSMARWHVVTGTKSKASTATGRHMNDRGSRDGKCQIYVTKVDCGGCAPTQVTKCRNYGHLSLRYIIAAGRYYILQALVLVTPFSQTNRVPLYANTFQYCHPTRDPPLRSFQTRSMLRRMFSLTPPSLNVYSPSIGARMLACQGPSSHCTVRESSRL